jgi:hypothetical protein
MSSISNCLVSSTPVGRIRFRWTGTFELKKASQIVLAESKVRTASGLDVKLDGWAVVERRAVSGVSGGKHKYDITLEGPPPSELASGSDVTIHIAFKKSNGGIESASGQATVDYGALSQGAPAAAPAPAPAPAAYGAPPGGPVGGPGGISTQLQYLTGFPFQVYDGVGGVPAGAPAGGAPAATSAKATVDAQMRAVLGRSAGTGGVTGMLAALDRSFQLVDDEGDENWVWSPQSYALQSDIGAGVTGEQASMARLAATVGAEILPLVAGLGPLIPESTVNPDEIAAAKAIFSESWPAFVAELGTDGGPRIPRTSGLLSDAATQLVTLGILLGVYPPGTSLPNGVPHPPFIPLSANSWPNPDRSNGVVTNDDEVNFTNFVIASDRVQLVINSYSAYIGTSSPIGPDRGYLVTLLQRALDASGQAAEALYGALDSVNLGQDEREVIYLPSSATDTSALTVEDVVSWAASFPAEEAATLLQDAGNVGVQSIVSRATALNAAIGRLTTLTTQSTAPPGLSHPRVIYALDVLSEALVYVVNTAGNPALTYTQPVAP